MELVIMKCYNLSKSILIRFIEIKGNQYVGLYTLTLKLHNTAQNECKGLYIIRLIYTRFRWISNKGYKSINE